MKSSPSRTRPAETHSHSSAAAPGERQTTRSRLVGTKSNRTWRISSVQLSVVWITPPQVCQKCSDKIALVTSVRNDVGGGDAGEAGGNQEDEIEGDADADADEEDFDYDELNQLSQFYAEKDDTEDDPGLLVQTFKELIRSSRLIVCNICW